MTDRLTPGMLRDLANIVQVWRNRGGHFESFHRALDEEAARREAEAKELGRTQLSDGVHHSAEAADCNPIVGRKGPGSADASLGSGVSRTISEPSPPSAIKPAPAADDLPMLTAEQMATLKLDVASGEIERGYNVRVCVSQLIRVIDAQAWENEALKARVAELERLYEREQLWYGASEKALVASKARVARLTECAGAARSNLLRGDTDCALENLDVALAEANDAG
jgi:hypothetical protein